MPRAGRLKLLSKIDGLLGDVVGYPLRVFCVLGLLTFRTQGCVSGLVSAPVQIIVRKLINGSFAYLSLILTWVTWGMRRGFRILRLALHRWVN